MSKEFNENPHWEKLSDAAKNVLEIAKGLAILANQDPVTSLNIMNAIVANYPEEVKRVIPSLSTSEIMDKLKDPFSLAYESAAGQDIVIERAFNIVEKMGDSEIRIFHLTMAAAEYCGFNIEKFEEIDVEKFEEIDVEKIEEKGASKLRKPKKETTILPTPTLNLFGRDLTALAAEGKLHPIIGREEEINLVAETLCRVFKRNPLLVGSAGVGKTAVVEGLANCIASGNITGVLKGKRIFELNMGAVVAGTKYRGMFEERLVQIIKEASNPNIILFIDEFQSVVGAGIAEGSPLDASTMLLPALARGELACIGACTDTDYHKYIEKNKALERRFQPIRIPELTSSATLDVLKNLGPAKFEKTYNLNIEEKVYPEVVDLAKRYMRSRWFPDKAIDILDHAVGRIVSKEQNEVTVNDIRDVIGALTGLPVGKLENELQNRLRGLSSFLKSRILGQDHIIEPVVDIIWPKTQGLDLRPERPNGVFLFAGPTGVGKTEFARALSEYLFGSQDKLIRIDMSEYSEPQTVSKFLGAPFGYIGFDQGSPILNTIAENPFSVLLLDEIEKAHPDIHRLFLQVFDSGVLTDTQRRHTFFSDVIIIMTSNIIIEQKQSIGFLTHEAETEARDQLTKYFSQEFLNRIDFIGIFDKLPIEIAQQILETRIIPILKERWQKKDIILEITPKALMLLVERGYNEKWGARNLERTVDELISSHLTKLISATNKKKKFKICIEVKDGSFRFKQI